MTDTEYDLVVLGAGPVGENVAAYAHSQGLTAVIVESELVGGECSYWACMPSKAMLRPIQALRAARDLDGAKQAVTGTIDTGAVLRRRDHFVNDFDDSGQVEWMESEGLDLVRGRGRLAGVKQVVVDQPDGTEVRLTARRAVAVCTGSAASVPPIEGLREAQPWTSREATGAQAVPESLVVIGGGVVACEEATTYAGLGTRVTLLARSGLLGGTELFAGELVGDGMRDLGVDVRLGTSPERVERTGDGVVVTLADGSTVQAAEVLVATGRSPRTADLGLASVGLEDGEWLDVDDTMLVSGATNDGDPWLYAVGDVNHRALLTHQGKYQARAAGRVIAARAKGEPLDDAPWGRHVATADARSVPQTTFTDPEVAYVGLTEQAARDEGLAVRTVEYDLHKVAGAKLYTDHYTGRAKFVVDDDRDVLLGATFVGPDVAELLQAATIAVVGEVPLQRLWHAVPAYPTVSEIWLRFLEKDGHA